MSELSQVECTRLAKVNTTVSCLKDKSMSCEIFEKNDGLSSFFASSDTSEICQGIVPTIQSRTHGCWPALRP